jgi:hypothetical protein
MHADNGNRVAYRHRLCLTGARAAALLSFSLLLLACGSGPGEDEDEGATESEPHAVAKFCNDLSRNGADVVLTAEVGFPVAASFSTTTGTCFPAAPGPCQAIPSGSAIPLTLRDGPQVLWQGTINRVDAATEWILVAELDEINGEPVLSGGPIKPEYQCSEIE